MTKNSIKLVIFDAAGVTWDGGFPKTCHYLAKKYKLPFKYIWRILHDKWFLPNCAGQMRSVDMWQKGVSELGLKISGQQAEKLHLRLHQPIKEMLNLSQQLRQQGYTTIVLTNNFSSYIRQFKKKFKLLKYFDAIFNSQELKISKTSPKIYNYIFKRFKVKPSQVVYFDDLEKTLVLPKKLGVHTIHFKDIKQLKNDLFKLLNPIKIIVVDGYGVVLSRGYPDTMVVLSKKYKIPEKRLYNIFYIKYFNQAAERKITQKQAWQLALDELKIPMTPAEIQKLHIGLFTINQPVFKLLKSLRKNYTVIMLSKNTRSQFAATKKKLPSVWKNVDAAINTWEFGLPKASKKTIHLISRRYQVKPAEILYVDDQQSNLVEAKKLGVKTIFYRNFQQFKREMGRWI